MQIIPVADIKNKQVVQAVRGKRANYQTIRSKLCSSSQPFEVIDALTKVTNSDIFYLADLDAIERINNDDNFHTIAHLAQEFSSHTFWVDAGFDSLDKLARWKTISNLRPVIGTESHSDITTLLQVLNSDCILSLDFKNDQLIGPTEIFEQPHHWPKEIILMSLDSVGSHSGPSFDLIKEFQARYKGKKFYAAGGVRHQQDLNKLTEIKACGVLIASALHNGQLILNDSL